MAKRSAEMKAGVVVVLGLAVLAFGLYLVSGGADQFRDKKRYTILFENGGGIGAGDAVYVAGRKVGKVVAVGAIETAIFGPRRTYVAVEIEVLKSARVHTDSKITVSKTVTSVVSLNIEFGEKGELAAADAKLPGTKQASFDDAIDEAAQLLRDARAVIGSVDKAVLRIDKMIQDVDMTGLRAKVDTFVDELNASATELKAIIKRAGPEVDAILAGARGGAQNLETLMADIDRDWGELAGTLKATLEGARRASKDLEAILSENRPALKAAVQSLADGVLRVGPVLERIEKLAQAAETIVIDAGPKLASGLRAASTAFKNFESVTEDLKTAPWKLVNEPSDEESREVHLYNAARSFVDGAERIQEVIEELEALRRKGGFSDTGMKARLDELAAQLEKSLRDYASREKKLINLLGGAKGSRKN